MQYHRSVEKLLLFVFGRSPSLLHCSSLSYGHSPRYCKIPFPSHARRTQSHLRSLTCARLLDPQPKAVEKELGKLLPEDFCACMRTDPPFRPLAKGRLPPSPEIRPPARALASHSPLGVARPNSRDSAVTFVLSCASCAVRERARELLRQSLCKRSIGTS